MFNGFHSTRIFAVILFTTTNNFLLNLDLPDDGPMITGGFPRYHIGDKVNINCTSYKYA